MLLELVGRRLAGVLTPNCRVLPANLFLFLLLPSLSFWAVPTAPGPAAAGLRRKPAFSLPSSLGDSKSSEVAVTMEMLLASDDGLVGMCFSPFRV